MSNDMSMMTDMAISTAMQPNFGVNPNGMALRQTTDPAQKEKELREASQGFEAIFLQKMWEEMRASLPENSMHGSKEEKYWQSMYAQHLGEEMAKNGGIGLADMMMRQLSKETVKSPSSANIFNRVSMNVSPAPLFPEDTASLDDVQEGGQNHSVKVDSSSSTNDSSAQAHVNHDKAHHHADNLYEEMELNGQISEHSINPALTNMGQVNPQNNSQPNNEPIVTTTRKETNSAGRTTTRTVSMPLSEYQSQQANGTNTSSAQQNLTANPLVESFANEQIHAPNYAEASEAAMVQDTMANRINDKPIPAPASDLMRQTLDELQNKVANAPINANDPIVIQTRYRTNLPASERTNALLSSNGSLSKQHEQAINEQMLEQQAKRSEQIALANMHHGSSFDDEMHDYPEELMSLGGNLDNTQVSSVEATPEQEPSLQSSAVNDPLAGIETRYISPTQLRMQEAMRAFEEKMATESKLQMENEAQAIAYVQSQIDTLIARPDRANYMFASASPQNMQAQYAHNSASHTLENMLTNSMQIKDTSNLIATNDVQSMQAIHNSASLPVYRSMPSLDVALKSGNLIASLTPEEIRLSQMGGSQNNNIHINMAEAVNIEEDVHSAYAGGPKFLQPEEAFPVSASTNKEGIQYVSGVSPQMNLQAPISGEINSPFGWRIDPFTKERAWHTGIDIAAQEGSAVQVAASGRVIFAGEYKDLGNTIIVEHENGMQSVYGHNSELLVQEGEEISTGTNIAKVGVSGRTSGAHLHFEVRHNGLAINPEPYLTQNNA